MPCGTKANMKIQGPVVLTNWLVILCILSSIILASCINGSASTTGSPGPQDARSAFRSLVKPTPTPSPDPEPVNLDFLDGFFNFLKKARWPLGIAGGIFILALLIWGCVASIRRGIKLRRLGPPIAKPKEKAQTRTKDRSALGQLYQQARKLADEGDFSQALVVLRRARVLALRQAGILPRGREYGTWEILQALSRAGADPFAYKKLAINADSVLFGERIIGPELWEELLALYDASGAPGP